MPIITVTIDTDKQKVVNKQLTDKQYEAIGAAINGKLTLVKGHGLSLAGWAGYYAHKAMLSAAPDVGEDVG